jgi:photosystem II stability/assembly factor-like uncharacterized protein
VVPLPLNTAGWARRPHHIDVDGRPISLGYFSDQPAAMLTAVCADGGTIAMLVVTPEPVAG